jgi:hypothetical protein
VRVVALELNHLCRRCSIGPGYGQKPDASVREDSIDVEENDLDAAGAILRRKCHASILPIACAKPLQTTAASA